MAVATHEVLDVQAALVAPQLANKGLVDEQTWQKLVDYIVTEMEKDMDRSLAERIMDQALGFLKLISMSPGRTFCPSKVVDIG